MVNQKEVDKLVEILKKQLPRYNEKQIKGAILAEGYAEDTALAVLDKLFPKKEEKPKQEANPVKKEEEKQEEPRRERLNPITKQEIKQEKVISEPEKEDFYKEVNYLLDQLKGINAIKKQEIQNPNLIKQETSNTNMEIPKELNAQIEAKKQELAKIKIESDDDNKVITKDGKTINLNDYPRREWRNYRDNGKTLAETKEEQMSKLRSEIYTLKKQAGRGNEVTQEEHISQKISDRVRQKAHGRIPEKRIDIEAKAEAEKLREKYKSEEVERQDLDTAADNIYTQMMKNPNIYGEEESKEENKDKKIEVKDEKKQESKKDNNELNDLNLDTNFNLDSNLNANDLGDEFDLGLDLNQDDKKNKKK